MPANTSTPSTDLTLRLQPATGYPCAAIRCATAAPITPSPITPTGHCLASNSSRGCQIAAALLLEILRHAPLEMQHRIQRVFRHRPGQSRIHQAHHRHVDRQLRIAQYRIDTGTEHQDRLQIRQSAQATPVVASTPVRNGLRLSVRCPATHETPCPEKRARRQGARVQVIRIRYRRESSQRKFLKPRNPVHLEYPVFGVRKGKKQIRGQQSLSRRAKKSFPRIWTPRSRDGMWIEERLSLGLIRLSTGLSSAALASFAVNTPTLKPQMPLCPQNTV